MSDLQLNARIYEEFDADHSLAHPASTHGGWKRHAVTVPRDTTALVCMHFWDCGSPEEYPGWWRAEDYLSGADRITRELLPSLLSSTRAAGMPVLHVTGGSGYCQEYEGYQRAVELAGPPPAVVPGATGSPAMDAIRELRRNVGHPGAHNIEDCNRGWQGVSFPVEAEPQPGELIAKDAHQLNACCRHLGVNHLVYVGFAVNWCLLMSPGGMIDMSRLGYTCSIIEDITGAVERRESAASEEHKEAALWKISVGFGLVLNQTDWEQALRS